MGRSASRLSVAIEYTVSLLLLSSKFLKRLRIFVAGDTIFSTVSRSFMQFYRTKAARNRFGYSHSANSDIVGCI